MTLSNSTSRYGSISIGLHRVMLLLLVAVYACMELRSFSPRGSDARSALQTWHFMLGLSVLVLVVLRLAARLSMPTPVISPQPPKWQDFSARVMHIALYAFMIGMRLAGWLILSAKGKSTPFFGLELPALIPENKDLGKIIKTVHETIATIGYFVIGLHAAAGLFHHTVARDNTLRRMLPTRE